MGNGEFQVPQHVRAEWREQVLNGKKVLQNQVTLQVFQFLVLSKLAEAQNISKIIERSIYSMPKTPKVIILNDQQGELFLLIQQSQYSLAQYLPKLQLDLDVLALLERLAKVLQCLVKKYGPFHLSSNLFGINKDQDIMVWINEEKYKNTPSSPILDSQLSEKIMVDQLIDIFIQHAHRNIESQLSLFRCPTFDKLQICLHKHIDRKKREILASLAKDHKKETIINRALSPQTSFGKKVGMIKCPTQKDISSRGQQKRNVVPKFIEKMKEKKTCLLQSLHHRRTLTREESEVFLAKQGSKTGTNEESRRKRNNSPSKSANKNLSPRMTPKKEYHYNKYQNKQHFGTSKLQSEQLTASGSTNNCTVNRKAFNQIAIIKSCGDAGPGFEKHTKTYSYPNSPETLDNATNYWTESTDSCLFESFQKVMKDSIHQCPFESKRSLGLYGGATTESKYIGQLKNKQMIIEEQSLSISRVLEDEINQFFPSAPKSPRVTLGVMNESLELAAQFGRIID